MFYVIIREQNSNDTPKISELVRQAYISNVTDSFLSALINEATFQIIVLIAAFLFICLQLPITYCLLSIPIVLLAIYILIYGSITMKAAQIMYEKKIEKCWVAEAYEPLFHSESPADSWYEILSEHQMIERNIKPEGRRKVIGTISVMRHSGREDWAWLFRLAVNKSYRRKGVGLRLVETAKEWCRENRYCYVELAVTEYQEGARNLFHKAGQGIFPNNWKVARVQPVPRKGRRHYPRTIELFLTNNTAVQVIVSKQEGTFHLVYIRVY